MSRLPDFRIDGPEPTIVPGAFVRGVGNYRIAFTPEPSGGSVASSAAGTGA